MIRNGFSDLKTVSKGSTADFYQKAQTYVITPGEGQVLLIKDVGTVLINDGLTCVKVKIV